MKKIILLGLFLLTLSTIGNAQFLNGVFVSWLPYQPCANSPVNFSAVDTSGNFQWAYFQWTFGDGASGQGQYTSHTYTAVGTYNGVLIVWDSLQGMDSIPFSITITGNCGNTDLVSGKVWNDLNGNGAQDGGESNLPNRLIRIMPGPYFVSTDQQGEYALNLPAGSFTLSAIAPQYHTVSFPGGGSHTVTTTGTGQSFPGNDFGLFALSNVRELSVTVWGAPPVPGFHRWYYLTYRNNGTTFLNPIVSFTPDGGLTFTSADHGGTWNGTSVNWNLPAIGPGDFGFLSTDFLVPQNTPLGETLCHHAVVNPISGDTIPSNNIDTLCQVVVGSYDPNDKSVVPAGVGPQGGVNPGTPFTYTIRFQNTGTFYATNVELRDTIDPSLDLATFTMLGASHTNFWYIDNGQIVWKFNNIMLPDSGANEPGSHGFVRFSIKHKDPIALGTEIRNKAAIYFDFNAPVITNEVVNTLEIVNSVREPKDMTTYELFPNPMTESAILRFDNQASGNYDLVVLDLRGQVVRQYGNIQGKEVRIERNDLTAGMYLFSLKNQGNQVATGKILVR